MYVSRTLERNGLIERDQDNTYLDLDGLEQDGISELQSHSISYRIAIGPRKGQKALTLQTLQAQPPTDVASGLVGKVTGFSLHAGVAAKAHERSKVERLCRYITRPPIAEARLSLTENGKIRYELKTPYRDGTTHIIFEPLDFIARLAALVPKPRVNLTRFHGVYAPNCKLRSVITSGGKTKSSNIKKKKINDDQSDVSRRAGMTWAQRLKRVFNIDISVCNQCGSRVKVISCIEDPDAISKILTALKNKEAVEGKQKAITGLPNSRAPPQMDLFKTS